MTKTILHIITGFGSGGAERMLARVALADHGKNAPRQIIVSLMDEGLYGALVQAAGVEFHHLGMHRGVPSPVGLWKLAQLLRRRRPDVIMTWLYHAALIGTLATILTATSTRRMIWNLRGADIDFTRSARMTRWVVRMLALMSSLPAVIVANSQAGLEYHSRLGYRPRRWAYLPNGFDLDEWQPEPASRTAVRAEWAFDDQTIAIGMVARADPQKDYPTLLAAAERLSVANARLRFVLVGKDTGQLSIPAALRGRVLALGERHDVQRLLRGLDIAVLSSAFGEGFPNFIGEAMATGLPCVVTDVGDAGALVGDTGLVVPPRAPAALAEAIARIAAESPDQRHQRGSAARLRITENFNLALVAANYRVLWHSVYDHSQ